MGIGVVDLCTASLEIEVRSRIRLAVLSLAFAHVTEHPTPRALNFDTS